MKIKKIILTIIFTFMFMPILVNAKELEIDFSKLYDDLSNYSHIQQEGWNYLVDIEEVKLISGGDIIYPHEESVYSAFSSYKSDALVGYTNAQGKLLMTFDYPNNYLAIMNNLTESDNIRVNIDPYLVDDYALDEELKNYDSIYVKFGAPIPKEDEDTLTVNLYQIKNRNELNDMHMILAEYFYYKKIINVNWIRSVGYVSNSSNKQLLSLNDIDGEIKIADGITYKDNFEYTFTEEDLTLLREVMRFPYKKLKVVFEPAPEANTNIPKDKTTKTTQTTIINPETGINILIISIILLSTISLATIILKNKKRLD